MNSKPINADLLFVSQNCEQKLKYYGKNIQNKIDRELPVSI